METYVSGDSELLVGTKLSKTSWCPTEVSGDIRGVSGAVILMKETPIL